MLCAGEAMKVMIPRQSGVIVNVSSVAGISGHPTESPYCVSKWAIIGFTKVLAIEARKHNIRVNTISPWCYANQRIRGDDHGSGA